MQSNTKNKEIKNIFEKCQKLFFYLKFNIIFVSEKIDVMADNNIELAQALEEKISILISRYKNLKTKYSRLEEENQKLSEELEKSNIAYSDLESQFKIYRLAMSVSGKSDDNTEAKRRINQIVREIDKCIALLNK